MKIRRNLANNLQALKKIKHVSTEEFAAELAVSKSTLQSYLNETGNPTVDSIEQIAAKLNIDTALLIHDPMSDQQQTILQLILGAINEVSKLPDEKQKELAALFRHVLNVWRPEEDEK